MRNSDKTQCVTGTPSLRGSGLQLQLLFFFRDCQSTLILNTASKLAQKLVSKSSTKTALDEKLSAFLKEIIPRKTKHIATRPERLKSALYLRLKTPKVFKIVKKTLWAF